MADLDKPFPLEEFQSLALLAGGDASFQPTIPRAHQLKLTRLGFLERRANGYAITPAGMARVVKGPPVDIDETT